MLAWLAAALAASSPAAAAPAVPVAVVETKAERDWTETVLTFPSAAKSPWPANDTVWAHLFVPRPAPARPAPAILVLPVMAAPNVWIETRFVERFVRDGFVVMWVEMPTQFHRRPDPSEPSGQVFLARTPKRLAANFRQSVDDARRALGVLAARPEADPDRVALFGISLGAIVSAVVYSTDPRPKFGAFLLGGADFPSLIVNSSLSGPFARKMGIEESGLRGFWKGLDPVDRRAENAVKPALLVNARSDTVIPKANALELARAFPAARSMWLAGGHYTAILHLVWLPRWISARLKEALGPENEGKKTIKRVKNS